MIQTCKVDKAVERKEAKEKVERIKLVLESRLKSDFFEKILINTQASL